MFFFLGLGTVYMYHSCNQFITAHAYDSLSDDVFCFSLHWSQGPWNSSSMKLTHLCVFFLLVLFTLVCCVLMYHSYMLGLGLNMNTYIGNLGCKLLLSCGKHIER